MIKITVEFLLDKALDKAVEEIYTFLRDCKFQKSIMKVERIVYE